MNAYFIININAQNVRLSGVVTDEHYSYIPHTYITILNKIYVADSFGKFNITAPSKTTLFISVTCEGYKILTDTVITEDKNIYKNWTLKKDNISLKDVKVISRLVNDSLKTQAIKAQIINTQVSKEQPSTLTEMMNRAAGIRIRQAGTLGAQSNLILNGFQNRSIRYFKDGIPTDYLGSGFDISLVPVNVIERAEVYRGVLPLYLGADALGGALNLVSKTYARNGLNASYECGSYNTHRATLNGFVTDKSQKLFAGMNAFYNHTDGDYKVDVHITNSETANLENINTKLFHNGFTNYYAEAFAGIANTKWADELKLSVTAFTLDKQYQFGTTMYKPFGAAKGEQYTIAPSLLYRKKFFNDRLEINEFAELNTLHSKIIDTLHGHYDWLGNFTYNQNELGELYSSQGSLSNISYRYLISRTNIRYNINDNEVLDLNFTVNNNRRKGSDPYGYTFSDGRDVLSEYATYNKTVAGIGLTSDFLHKKLRNNFIVKFYQYHTQAHDITVQRVEENVSNTKSQWGVADGIKYNLSDNSFIQMSAETALRLPAQDELFGDGNLKIPNFSLKPERSFNLNLSYSLSEALKYRFEVNAFYRYTKDMILLVPVYFLNSQDQNVDKVRGEGLDADASYYIFPWLNASGNFTYQNLRLVNTSNPTTNDARLRNTPYFFFNLGANADLHKIFGRNDRLQIYWYYSFVRMYYLDYIPKSVEPSGFLGLFGKAHINAQNIIPDQNLHTSGFTYYPDSKHFSIGLQIKNIFNARIYDEFKVQNPGRNFSLKISYSL